MNNVVSLKTGSIFMANWCQTDHVCVRCLRLKLPLMVCLIVKMKVIARKWAECVLWFSYAFYSQFECVCVSVCKWTLCLLVGLFSFILVMVKRLTVSISKSVLLAFGIVSVWIRRFAFYRWWSVSSWTTDSPMIIGKHLNLCFARWITWIDFFQCNYTSDCECNFAD